MDELDIFKDWPQEYIDEYLASPSPELYDELSEAVLIHSSGAGYFDGTGLIYEERNVFDETTGQYRKEFIAHYGTPRHSGRYPWGSGKNPQRHRNWLQRADELHKQGLSEKEVAAAFGMSTTDYREIRRRYREKRDVENQRQAIKWRDDGHSNTEIAKRLGVSEGTVRNYLDPTKKRRENKTEIIASNLAEMLKTKPYLDVGEGVGRQLNISDQQLHAALLYLKDEGYNVLNYDLHQVTNPKQFTSLKVLCDGTTTQKDLKEHLSQITTPDGLYFENYGEEAKIRKPIPSIDSSRVAINYNTGKPGGGQEKDGVIEIRPGTEDLSLGNRNYAQVRIGVDGTHYLKGMAIYGDPKKMPEGVDVVFNTNKHEGTPMIGDGDNSVLKKMKKDQNGEIDAQNPFGASFRQWEYTDADGKSHISPINIVNDDADWDRWQKNLSSQFLSKQLPVVAKKQLDIRYGEMKDEFEEYRSLTNPTLKKEFLEEFADNCDAAAVHLKAAALPRQASFAILPVPSLKDNEVYAPAYENGEEVILVRHPHAGRFEIPRLIVNNDNPEGKETLGTSPAHAIGINSTVAKQLSGADYDGDTVLVIPTVGQKLQTRPPLDGLKDFDPSEMYSRSPDDPVRTGKGDETKRGDGFNKGAEMGKVSNLITDMQIIGCNEDEITRAVKHSMVVIDAEKHNLDWQQSEIDNGIAELRLRYQGKEKGGAATLISKAKGRADIPERKEVYGTKPMSDEEYKEYLESGGKKNASKLTPDEYERYKNGEVIYRNTNRTYPERKKITDPAKMTAEELALYESGKPVYRNTGKVKKATKEIDKMSAVKDAHELSSGYYMEEIYADHANRLKALANEARKEARAAGTMDENSTAKKTYADVVGKDGTLTKKLDLAALEAPKERQAQMLASSVMDAKIAADPTLKEKDNLDKRKKLASKALADARDAVRGGTHEKRFQIVLSDREWDAIQAGAISSEKFKQVIRYSDKEKLKQRALPRQKATIPASTKSRARIMLNSGMAPSTVAKELGISYETLKKEFKNFNGIAVDDD